MSDAPKLLLGFREYREVFNLPEGDLIITYPNRLSPASLADVEEYFSLLLKKLKRWQTLPEVNP